MAGRAAGRSAAAGALASRADILWGVPGDLLAGRAVGARMLVLGSYGEGASSGMLAGSLALALLDRVRCPVAVIRGSAPQVPPPGIGPVVVGVDGSSAGRAALTFAAGLAGSWAAPLVAVHVGRHRRRDPRRSPPHRGPGDVLEAEAGALLEAELDAVAVSHPDLTVQREVVWAARPFGLSSPEPVARGSRRRASRHHSGMLHHLERTQEFAPCPVVVIARPRCPPGRLPPPVVGRCGDRQPTSRHRWRCRDRCASTGDG